MHLGAFKGHLKVLDKERKVVADTRETGKKQGRHHNAVEFEVTPGESYILETGNYFLSLIPNALFLTFDLGRWFQPAPELDKVEWWKIVK